MTYPSIYPTGATIYDPKRCWNGYTIFQAKEVGALLIDMNGGEVQLWKEFHGMPNRILPGGYLIGSTGERNTAYGVQDGVDLVQVDWDGNVVWRFNEYEYIEDPGEEPQWMARQHHAHMIPRGLPGEGNIMVFDNGGWAGYGSPNPGSPTGFRNALRDYSRVLELDPITLKVVWQYSPAEAGLTVPVDANRFYSPFISSAQRLLNGNTMITEGSGGRIIEVTPQHEIVWESISPSWGKMMKINMIYRAYRVPYDWVPQVEKPDENPIERLDVTRFRVPGASQRGPRRVVNVQGVLPYRSDAALCVLTEGDETGSK